MSTTKSDKRHEEECGTYTRKKHKHTTVPTEINNKKTHNKVYHTLEISLIPHAGADVRLQLTHIYNIWWFVFHSVSADRKENVNERPHILHTRALTFLFFTGVLPPVIFCYFIPTVFVSLICINIIISYQDSLESHAINEVLFFFWNIFVDKYIIFYNFRNLTFIKKENCFDRKHLLQFWKYFLSLLQ